MGRKKKKASGVSVTVVLFVFVSFKWDEFSVSVKYQDTNYKNQAVGAIAFLK